MKTTLRFFLDSDYVEEVENNNWLYLLCLNKIEADGFVAIPRVGEKVTFSDICIPDFSDTYKEDCDTICETIENIISSAFWGFLVVDVHYSIEGDENFVEVFVIPLFDEDDEDEEAIGRDCENCEFAEECMRAATEKEVDEDEFDEEPVSPAVLSDHERNPNFKYKSNTSGVESLF